MNESLLHISLSKLDQKSILKSTYSSASVIVLFKILCNSVGILPLSLLLPRWEIIRRRHTSEIFNPIQDRERELNRNRNRNRNSDRARKI